MKDKSEKVLKIVAAGVAAFSAYSWLQRNRMQPPIFYREKLPGNYNAQTIPPFGIFILESQKENKALLDHELIHWRQYQEKGLIPFYNSYFAQLKRYGYDLAPMEIEARANETDFCKTNYTECVRNGQAKTVFNPNFRL